LFPEDGIRAILADCVQRVTAWSAVQERLENVLGTECYLGGDGLRPYVTWASEGAIQLRAMVPAELPTAPLIEEILRGDYGFCIADKDVRDPRILTVQLPRTPTLTRRLEVPELLLIGLGDAARYRGARLALGIARLAQWLRFAHAAHVRVVDYNMTDDPLTAVKDILDTHAFGIVGISVNFGQWRMLTELAPLVNEYRPPVVALGNILAAFSARQALSQFEADQREAAFVATGLGERPMESLCRRFRDPESWASIDGLTRCGTSAPSTVKNALPGPPELVFPDDTLIMEIIKRTGQVSMETSFGCQYGACTFCPRDHRGEGWTRGNRAATVAVLRRLAPTEVAVSFVDEEFFGSEGLLDPPLENLPAAQVLAACRELEISYELYTRLQQIFDRGKSPAWNLQRARLLATEASHMRRIFVGVESGSPSQLRRYGKGQTVEQTADALRVGSSLGLPMEFGFITFDPLLTPSELTENIEFLARTDIMSPVTPGGVQTKLEKVADYLDGKEFPQSGTALYHHVAYMATELEVLAHSRYADHLHRKHPELLDGDYDPGFARYGTRYRDIRIGDIAGWCRVWTEGMFAPVYEARMTARTADHPSTVQEAAQLVARYRDATFSLILNLTARILPETDARLAPLLRRYELPGASDPVEWLDALARRALPEPTRVEFDRMLVAKRREG